MAYFEEKTDFTERFVVNFLNDCGIPARRNNLERVTDVDILTSAGIRIDVQCSEDFAHWGDLRLDIVSAFRPKNSHADKNYVWNKNLSMLDNFAGKFHCEVLKPGKIMFPDYLDFLAVLFYNNGFKAGNPDKIMLVSRMDIIAYVLPRREELFSKIKINNKAGLPDTHGSAFIPVNAHALANHAGCVFGSIGNMTAERVRACLEKKAVFGPGQNNGD